MQRKRREYSAGIKISKIQIHSDRKSNFVFPSRSNRNYLGLLTPFPSHTARNELIYM